MKSLKRAGIYLPVLVLSTIFINCSGTMNTINTITSGDTGNESRSALEEIENDSLVAKYAPEELARAKQAIAEAEATRKNGENPAAVERRMLMAEQRVRIAKKAAEMRVAQQQMQQRAAELSRLRKQLREVERQGIASGQIEQTLVERARTLSFFESHNSDRGLILRFKDIRFSSEGATLMSNAEPPINELAEFLRLYPERRILIEGHTDATGSASFNQRLSQQRADVVRDALLSRGVDASRIEAIGIGEDYPIASNDTKAGRERNRRVDVVVSDEKGVIHARTY